MEMQHNINVGDAVTLKNFLDFSFGIVIQTPNDKNFMKYTIAWLDCDLITSESLSRIKLIENKHV